MGALSCFQSLFRSPRENIPSVPPTTRVRHAPPPGAVADYFASNPTAFGRILDGGLPCRTYQESAELLTFRDRSPAADLHALVIPKRRVENVRTLTPDDAGLVRDMRRMGLEVLEREQPRALAANDYILCFHVPPFYSVDHLHLHVLAPASGMCMLFRDVKFRCGTRWCISDLEVIERLEKGLVAVPSKDPF